MDADAAGGAVGDRRLVETAVTLLLVDAPAGWRHLHVEFEPERSLVAATVTTADADSASLVAQPGAIDALSEYHRRATSSGQRWRRLVIDCDSDGTLSARTDPATAAEVRRWVRRILMAITVGCLIAAAAIFALDWRWSEPPRLGVLGVPPPARAQQAFAVLTQWYDAEDKGDASRMRELACAHPTRSLADWINTIAYYGQDQGLVFPDALTQFRDNGSTVWVKVAVRIRPIDDRMKREVEAAQARGGFFFETLTLADEGGTFKVCDGQR